MDRFELHRCADGLIYRFDRVGRHVFARADDADMRIAWEGLWGWTARLPKSGVLAGRPWETLPAFQVDTYPPQGIWISCREARSHVYTLIHTGR